MVEVTIPLSIISFVLGLILAVLTAVARVAEVKGLKQLSEIYIWIFRGTLLLVQLFIIYFGLPIIGITLDVWAAAIITFSLNIGAYASEAVRAAILSVPKGQWEAATSLGMGYAQILRRIIASQAARISLPPLSNIFISTLKETSLVASITMVDMFMVAQRIAARVKFMQNTLGATLAPTDAYYLIRGLKTLSVRFDRQSENTLKIIKFLETNDAVARVNYAGSHSAEEKRMQQAQASGIGAVISLELAAGYDYQVFAKSLKLFDLAVSLGGVESLVCHPASMTHESYSRELQDKIGINQNLLRLAIGIENADDLIADIAQALKKAKI